MRTLSLFLFLALFVSACTNAGTDTEGAGEEATQEESTMDMVYSLEPFSESTDYPDAAIESVSFQNGQFDFQINNYELAVQTPDAEQKMCANSAKGQHIHVIVDKQPYTAHYEADFEYEIEDGEHYLLSFLSRSYHESLKRQDAHWAKKIMVENNSFSSTEDISGPMMFYSRPKGTYVGSSETEKVMLDFYLINADLGEQYKVKASINGEEHMIDTWQPYYISGLPIGENTIELTLLDAEGNPADIPLNPVSRTFTLKADPAESM